MKFFFFFGGGGGGIRYVNVITKTGTLLNFLSVVFAENKMFGASRVITRNSLNRLVSEKCHSAENSAKLSNFLL